ncbi:MAG: sodium:alanine symporter family protein, partial [Geminicoccaceae bacterium]|nr:sodium:alanine symporter family protein [Geminicoccaceae bacterium]
MDEKINEAFANSTGWFVNFIFSPFPGTTFPWIVAWLVIAATIFTLYFGFVQFRAFPHSIALVKGDYSDPNDAGEVSHFQALATALSGTVGLGNIAGVAVAVGIGGPGATFWMILAGLLGMASKFTECTLGVKYRNEYEDGTVSGG